MKMYHPITSDYKKISSSADMVETVISDYMSLHGDFDLDQSKQIFSCLSWCAIEHSCKTISSSDNILENQISIIWFFTITLTLKTANQFFWKTIWLMKMHHHTKFGSKKGSAILTRSLEDHILTSWSFAVTFTLNTAIHFLHKTLWLILCTIETTVW